MEGDTVRGRRMIHAVEAPHEVEMPPATAEFTVGDYMQAGGFLLGHQLGDEPVFHGLEFDCTDCAGGEVHTGDLEFGRAQVGTDHIGMERCVMGIRHWMLLRVSLSNTYRTIPNTPEADGRAVKHMR